MKIASVVYNNFIDDNRVYKVADSLTKRGHDVTVVAVLKGNVLEHENYHGVNVHRIKLKSLFFRSSSKVFNAIRFFEFFIRVAMEYRRSDVIHCNDIEGFLAGVFAKITRPAVKLVYDSHEYQKEKYGLSRFARAVIGLLERLFISWADVFITISPSIGEEYKRLYGIKKYFLVMNAPHLADGLLPRQGLKATLGLEEDRILFIYQGKFAKSRGIEVLLQSFAEDRFSNLNIVFMGSGPLKQIIDEYALSYSNIYVLPPVPYRDLIQVTSGADFGFVSTQNLGLNNYMCLPNKLFEYIQSEVPILTNDLLECRRLVGSEDIGVVIDEYTPQGVWNAIQGILQKSTDSMKMNIRSAKRKYNWETQETILFSAYDSIGI